MQVSLAVPDEGLRFYHLDASSFVTIKRAFWVFSIMILLLSGVIWLLLLVIPLAALTRQVVWGFWNRGRTSAEGPIQARKEGTSKV
jgi:hypothetical protein